MIYFLEIDTIAENTAGVRRQGIIRLGSQICSLALSLLLPLNNNLGSRSESRSHHLLAFFFPLPAIISTRFKTQGSGLGPDVDEKHQRNAQVSPSFSFFSLFSPGAAKMAVDPPAVYTLLFPSFIQRQINVYRLLLLSFLSLLAVQNGIRKLPIHHYAAQGIETLCVKMEKQQQPK